MSGILCVYNTSGVDQTPQPYLSALRLLTHRGQAGEVCELRRDLFIGVRLSTVGRRASENPLTISAHSKVLIALDGQLHNHKELANALKTKGYPTELSSDPAIVRGAFAEYGERLFESLRGTWAIVLWDDRTQQLFAARDPLGVKPLYYFTDGRNLIIASEIKSIIALNNEAREINHRRIRQLVCDGQIDDWTDTCFSRIKPVPPGTVLRFDGDQITPRRYWNLRPSTARDVSLDDVVEKLAKAVERHTPSDMRIGLALSGGIDSSSIAGILTHKELHITRDVQAFSIRPPGAPDESHRINATIRRTGIPHSYVPLDSLDYSRSLVRLIKCHDEPIDWSGVFYQFFLRQRMAEAGCKAVLVGYGADEIFSGYEYLALPFLGALIAHGHLWDAARFTVGSNEFFGSKNLVKQTLRYLLLHGNGRLAQSAERTMRFLLKKPKRVAYRGGLEVLAPSDDAGESETLSDLADFDLGSLRKGRIFFNGLLTCFRENIPLLVRLEDRNAMAHSLELCAPFMDEELVQIALSFPFQEYMKNGWNKAILRKATHHLLAPEVSYYKPKVATPGNDEYLAFDVLRQELLDLLNSRSFYNSCLWSPRCLGLYLRDLAQNSRGNLWFRVYNTHKWYEEVARLNNTSNTNSRDPVMVLSTR